MIDEKDIIEEEEENSELWRTTFADLTTLLLVFFVLLYSMSTIDAGRYLASFASIKSALGKDQGSPIVVQDDQAGVFMNEVAQYRQIVAGQKKNFASFNQYSTDHGIEGIVGANLEAGIITLQVPADTFFKPGSADLTKEAIHTITILKDYFLMHRDLKINIKGHTDITIPSPTSRFKDNWELSSMRAVAVLRLLLQLGMEPDRLTGTGMGSFQPAVPNTTVQNRAKNRRVEFVLEKMIGGVAQ